MLPILCTGITKTNIGLKVSNCLPLTLTDFPPQALFACRLILRVKLLKVNIFSNRSFIIPPPVAFIPSL